MLATFAQPLAGDFPRTPVWSSRLLPGPERLLESAAAIQTAVQPPMIELNPVRQRIADLTGRVISLRGYL